MEIYTEPIAAIVIFVVVADLEQDPRLREVFATRWVVPWHMGVATAMERGKAMGDLPKDLDVQYAADLAAGMIFQRVLVARRPANERLASQLVDLLMERILPETGSAGEESLSQDTPPDHR